MENPCLDDSLCILYEKVQLSPEVVIVHEVINNSSDLETDVPSVNVNQIVDLSVTIDEHSVSVPRENIEPQAEVFRTPKLFEEKVPKPNTRKEKQKIECGICFDGPDEISDSNRCLMSTVCGHIFCDSCLKVSMTNSRMCPKCRKRLGKKMFHPLYF